MNNCLIHNENLNFKMFDYYANEVKKSLSQNPSRYAHSISVAITAINLGTVYNANLDDCMVGGILHDYCKCVPIDEMIKQCEKENVPLSEEDKKAVGCLHGFLAANVCKKKFGVNDAVYNAIYFHTCGKPNMTILEKVIFVADFIEPLRAFRDTVSHVRKIAWTDIDEAVILSINYTIDFLKKNNSFIHSNTLQTLKYYEGLKKMPDK